VKAVVECNIPIVEDVRSSRQLIKEREGRRLREREGKKRLIEIEMPETSQANDR